jgi:hypothetical protein
MPALPFKLNQDRRRHIPRQVHKVTNWPAYDASLRQRGSLTVWFSAEAIEGGRRSRARLGVGSPGTRLWRS